MASLTCGSEAFVEVTMESSWGCLAGKENGEAQCRMVPEGRKTLCEGILLKNSPDQTSRGQRETWKEGEEASLIVFLRKSLKVQYKKKTSDMHKSYQSKNENGNSCVH